MTGSFTLLLFRHHFSSDVDDVSKIMFGRVYWCQRLWLEAIWERIPALPRWGRKFGLSNFVSLFGFAETSFKSWTPGSNSWTFVMHWFNFIRFIFMYINYKIFLQFRIKKRNILCIGKGKIHNFFNPLVRACTYHYMSTKISGLIKLFCFTYLCTGEKNFPSLCGL